MTRPPVEVRRAGVDDLEELLLLWAQARQEGGRNGRAPGGAPAEQIRPRLRETLNGSETHVLVARYEGVSAGYAVLRVAPVLAVLDGPALHIDHLYVTPQTRRRGVARAMLSAATAIAERHGADQVLAGAPPSAKETHRFLARLGFSPLVVRRVVATATLRRRLAGEGQRRGLEDLLSRRRSLRARGLRPGWPGGGSGADPDADEEPGGQQRECGDGAATPTSPARPAGRPAVRGSGRTTSAPRDERHLEMVEAAGPQPGEPAPHSPGIDAVPFEARLVDLGEAGLEAIQLDPVERDDDQPVDPAPAPLIGRRRRART